MPEPVPAPSPPDPTPPAPSAPPRAPTVPGPEDVAYWTREHPQHAQRVQAVLQQRLAHHDEVLPPELDAPAPTLTIPDTVIETREDRWGVEGLAHRLGLDQSTGQAVVDYVAGLRASPPPGLPAATYTDQTGMAALEAAWGAETTARLELARQVFDTLPARLKAFLNDEGWGDDPRVIAYFSQAGARRALRTVTNTEQRERLRRWSPYALLEIMVSRLNRWEELRDEAPPDRTFRDWNLVAALVTERQRAIAMQAYRRLTRRRVPAAMLILTLLYLIHPGAFGRIKPCRACRVWFVDYSRNRSAQDCSARCREHFWTRTRRRAALQPSQLHRRRTKKPPTADTPPTLSGPAPEPVTPPPSQPPGD
jgi:predicted RNA-binding Zn ribbon-like protein